jgi:pyridoxal phosphate enzyme (YggS family)
MMETIAENIRNIEERISRACQRAGRAPQEITLIAVSKTFPPEVVAQAYKAGLRIFGENKPQELRDKSRVLPEDIEWHFIGHLQTNKIKYVVPAARLIHSVDSLHLAQALNAYCEKHGHVASVLLEVNTSGEASKFGFAPSETEQAFAQIMALPALRIYGLMTIGPLTDDKEKIREAFKTLRLLNGRLREKWGAERTAILSMGMSGDFEIAIEEGSTHIRLGTAIFGQRGR